MAWPLIKTKAGVDSNLTAFGVVLLTSSYSHNYEKQ